MDNNIQRNGNGDEVIETIEIYPKIHNLILLVIIFQATNDRQPPPPTPIGKNSQLSSGQILKKDKRVSSSRFNISKNRELTPLPRLTGQY